MFYSGGTKDYSSSSDSVQSIARIGSYSEDVKLTLSSGHNQLRHPLGQVGTPNGCTLMVGVINLTVHHEDEQRLSSLLSVSLSSHWPSVRDFSA